VKATTVPPETGFVRRADKGAHFYRCDFQVHTPRDEAWRGPRARTDEERQRFADDFVAACRRKGLHAVAITDQHDMLFVPFIREAAQREVNHAGQRYPEDQRLVVFPGIELTLALARQALLLLDADFASDRFTDVLQALAITPHDPESPTLPPVTTLEHISSLAELHRILNQRDWLHGHYIVLPNVTDKGHKSIMRKGMQSEYKEMPCVGGYLDGSVDKTGTGNSKILAGEDAAWGHKALAVFQTSDARDSMFEDLGKHSTWVKWARPTAEALRQACLGQQSRIAQSQPELPTVFISRLTVSNSKFFGPLDLDFNTQYNAVIGGRGTGKSTILDYLRWGLCELSLELWRVSLCGRLAWCHPRVMGWRLQRRFSLNLSLLCVTVLIAVAIHNTSTTRCRRPFWRCV
jgi:chromosome segregation protein